MISSTPSLFEWSTSRPNPNTLEALLDRYAGRYERYGSGKVALRDGLATFASPGENVLLPSYLPDAVIEPLYDIALEPRQYQMTETLTPAYDSLEAQLDEQTAAVVSVNYFGFPQPGLAELIALAEEYDCYHVEDNAHSALSFDGDTLLGTRGDIGFTSLWKLLPVPNGALLYLNEPSIAKAFTPTSCTGVRDRLDGTDYQFILKSLANDILESNTMLKESLEVVLSSTSLTQPTAPATRYAAAKTPMSRLTARVVADADPERIRTTRRANYRAWASLFHNRPDVELVFDSLPPGVCPQVCPVRTNHPTQLRAILERHGVAGVHQWPRLSRRVLEDPQYEVARTLAREIVVLPVHQHIDSDLIATVGAEIAS